MRAVNLLPPEIGSGRAFAARFDPLIAAGIALTVVVAIVIGGAFVLGRTHASSQQEELALARAALANAVARQTAVTGTPVVAVPAAVGQVPTWKAAVDTALSMRVPYDLILAQIGRIVPARITLKNLTVGAATSSAAAAAAGGDLAIAGSAFNHDDVAQLLARLALIPQVTGATLTSSTADSTTGVVTFTIAAQLKGASTAFTTTGPGTTSTTTTTSGAGA